MKIKDPQFLRALADLKNTKVHQFLTEELERQDVINRTSLNEVMYRNQGRSLALADLIKYIEI